VIKRSDSKKLVSVILAQYLLNADGIHGVPHWGRVLENGRRLAWRMRMHIGLDDFQIAALISACQCHTRGQPPASFPLFARRNGDGGRRTDYRRTVTLPR